MSEQKHDGSLDPMAYAFVQWRDGVHSYNALGTIRGVHIASPCYSPGSEDTVELNPAQALSLLAWLQQERETLEQLAKEQGE